MFWNCPSSATRRAPSIPREFVHPLLPNPDLLSRSINWFVSVVRPRSLRPGEALHGTLIPPRHGIAMSAANWRSGFVVEISMMLVFRYCLTSSSLVSTSWDCWVLNSSGGS